MVTSIFVDATTAASADKAALANFVSQTGGERHPYIWSVYARLCFRAGKSGMTAGPTAIRIGRHNVYVHRYRFLGTRILAMCSAFVESGGHDDIWRTGEDTMRGLASHGPVEMVALSIPGLEAYRQAIGTPIRWKIAGNYLAMALPTVMSDTMPLGESYEKHLMTLGKHTRRNIRNIRKKADEEGISYHFETPRDANLPEQLALGTQTRPEPISAEKLKGLTKFAQAQPGGFQSMLRDRDGALLSCCTGFIERDRAIILTQPNHGGYPKLSLSLMNRAYLMELLIGRGVREIYFPFGTVGVLNNAMRTEVGAQLYFVKRTPLTLMKAVFVTIERKLVKAGFETLTHKLFGWGKAPPMEPPAHAPSDH